MPARGIQLAVFGNCGMRHVASLSRLLGLKVACPAGNVRLDFPSVNIIPARACLLLMSGSARGSFSSLARALPVRLAVTVSGQAFPRACPPLARVTAGGCGSRSFSEVAA